MKETEWWEMRTLRVGQVCVNTGKWLAVFFDKHTHTTAQQVKRFSHSGRWFRVLQD